MRIKMTGLIGLTVHALCSAQSAGAQTINTRVFDTIVPFSYDRGHNIGVTDRPRPEYDPLGVPVGGFDLHPSVAVDTGYTDNVYQTQSDEESDGFVSVNPALRVTSDWSVHSFSIEGSGALRRYFNATERNEDGWALATNGRLDLSPDKSLSLGANTRRMYETQFSGATATQSRSALPVQTSTVRGDANLVFSRLRAVVAADWSRFNYMPINALDGTVLTQRERDRDVERVIGHVEYGISPDTGIFLQAMGTHTGYGAPLLSGLANRDSDEARILAGVSTDLTSLLRGSIGVGYVSRRYDSALYNDISGVSVDAKVEYFPTELTTVSLSLRRQIEDSVVAGSSGYWNNGGAIRIDHELLRNLLVNVGADYERDSYRGISGTGKIFRAAGGADYFINNIFGLNVRMNYSKRTNNNFLIGQELKEFRFTAGISVRR